MVLADTEIIKRLDMENDLKIFPVIHEREHQIKGAKVDLHLSGVFYEIKYGTEEIYDPIEHPVRDYRREFIFPLNKPYILHPGMFALAPTYENIAMPNDLLGMLEGKSSLGRLGVVVHATASFVDPGYKGAITLELSNLGHLPVGLYPLAPVATIAFLKIEGEVKHPYSSKNICSPFTPTEKIEHGHYAAPISLPSRYGWEWEFDALRKIKQRAKIEDFIDNIISLMEDKEKQSKLEKEFPDYIEQITAVVKEKLPDLPPELSEKLKGSLPAIQTMLDKPQNPA